MMQIDIHDVGHGACSVVTCPDGTRFMIDGGRSRSWRPSNHYEGEFINTLIMQNLDEDHVEDLPAIWDNIRLGAIVTNPTVNADALDWMKPDGMRAGVEFVHGLLPRFPAGGVLGTLPLSRGGGVSAWMICNHFDTHFTDTNNLSVAVFFHYGDFTILFAGDLEKAGWNHLMTRPEFRAALPRVNILVASHHGRENGCCDRAFELLRPNVVVFSDDDIRFGTQDTLPWYRARTTGIPVLGAYDPVTGYKKRKVLTTRRDGHMRIDIEPSGRYVVHPERDAGSHYSDAAFAELLAGIPPAPGGPFRNWPGL